MRHRKKPVVDASSAILLYKAGFFGHLSDLYALQVALRVFRELTDRPRPGSDYFRQLAETAAIHLHEHTRPAQAGTGRSVPLAENPMGEGERETLVLYAAGRADFVIIDDRKGAGFCRDFHIPYINALLVPRILQLAGRLSPSAARAGTDALLTIGRYSRFIRERAENLTDAELARFLP